MSKPVVKIENWSIALASPYYYLYPPVLPKDLDKIKLVLWGSVIDHPRLGTMPDIRTSLIIGLNEGPAIETMNTIYLLGKPSQRYEEIYPNAKEALTI